MPSVDLHIFWKAKPLRHTNMVRRYCGLMVALQAHQETDKGPPSGPRGVTFDTDSFEIGMDNRASRCMSHRIEDFDGPLRHSQKRVRGWMNALSSEVRIGTLRWVVEDDQGRRHVIRIPNSIYIPEGGVHLLSPQHWAQEAKDSTPRPRGTRCITYDDCIILEWNQCQFRRTCSLDHKGGNVATIRSAPGIEQYEAYEALLPPDVTFHLEAFPAKVSDSEEEPEEQQQQQVTSQTPAEGLTVHNEEEEVLPSMPTTETFSMDGPAGTSFPIVDPDEEDRFASGDEAAELLHYHHRFGHASMSRLRTMAKQGIIPRRL